MSAAMERYIELVKQYHSQEQVDLAIVSAKESDIESDGSATAEEVEEDGEKD